MNYDVILFDFDGTLCNSNNVKTSIFYDISKDLFGVKAADEFIVFHKKNGGVSRHAKFDWLLKKNLNDIVPESMRFQELKVSLVKEFAAQLAGKLNKCSIIEDLSQLKNKTKRSDWGIITGGDIHETKTILIENNYLQLFKLGVLGNLNTKDENFELLQKNNLLKNKIIYIGDTRLDYEFSMRNNIDFGLVTAWSEDPDLMQMINMPSIIHATNVHEIMRIL
jgi:phosphoglycolate phosphatase-like HAD superfamily hydrolase